MLKIFKSGIFSYQLRDKGLNPSISIYINHSSKKNPPEPKPTLGAGVKSYILKILSFLQFVKYIFIVFYILKFSRIILRAFLQKFGFFFSQNNFTDSTGKQEIFLWY